MQQQHRVEQIRQHFHNTAQIESQSQQTQTNNNVAESREPDHYCGICGQTFYVHAELMTHYYASHPNLEDEVCQYPSCPAKFFENIFLVAHVNTVHLGLSKGYFCRYCREGLSTYNELWDHYAAKHSGMQGVDGVFTEEEWWELVGDGVGKGSGFSGEDEGVRMSVHGVWVDRNGVIQRGAFAAGGVPQNLQQGNGVEKQSQQQESDFATVEMTRGLQGSGLEKEPRPQNQEGGFDDSVDNWAPVGGSSLENKFLRDLNYTHGLLDPLFVGLGLAVPYSQQAQTQTETATPLRRMSEQITSSPQNPFMLSSTSTPLRRMSQQISASPSNPFSQPSRQTTASPSNPFTASSTSTPLRRMSQQITASPQNTFSQLSQQVASVASPQNQFSQPSQQPTASTSTSPQTRPQQPTLPAAATTTTTTSQPQVQPPQTQAQEPSASDAPRPRHQNSRYHCPYCGPIKHYSSRRSLLNHLTNKHSGDENHACTFAPCTEKFHSDLYRLEHESLVHKGKTKGFECRYCRKEYAKLGELENHARNKHTAEKGVGGVKWDD
ncbi:hypothetical protein G7Y89_g6337 [Cudoniella acicularis]|uniref:C2H2-type domain-containing protein n=1 Tax=Cudoniella acicularis TaxID=354080 RepID=A0A8H4W336_9HELO|nr:hypothetical protein G7Y89_g6337 [Cudoniella acicularis]